MTRILAVAVALAMSLVPEGAGADEAAIKAASTPGKTRGPVTRGLSQPVLAPALQGPKARSLPVYKLPPVGKPRRRISGGRRGPIQDLPTLHALAPEHVGQTLSIQPVLCWYLSAHAPEGSVIQLTLIDEEAIEPQVDVSLPSAHRAGIHCAELSDYGAALETGREYQWSVALMVDRERRSLDVIATGWIERVEAPVDLVRTLAHASPDEAVGVYASAGLWYDAVGSTHPALDAGRASAQAQMGLGALLEQVRLDQVDLLMY